MAEKLCQYNYVLNVKTLLTLAQNCFILVNSLLQLLDVEIAVPNSLEGTRLKIVSILQKQGSASVDQLAQQIGLASATIRRHLDILQREQLVSFQQVHKKLGRPELSYFLTEVGQESGYRDYQGLLALLLAEMRSLAPADLVGKAGEDLLRVLINRIADQVSQSYLDSAEQSLEIRVSRVKQALAEGGFSPEVSQDGRQVWVHLCNCPFRAAALCQELVCLFDQKLIANILGVEPVRQATIRSGDKVCSYVAALPS